jgi:hypothetical protein
MKAAASVLNPKRFRSKLAELGGGPTVRGNPLRVGYFQRSFAA